MGSYQGSDWFKSGAHVRVSPPDTKQQLVHQASQQLAEYSKRLQVAYDGGLALFKNNFSGTDAQVCIRFEVQGNTLLNKHHESTIGLLAD